MLRIEFTAAGAVSDVSADDQVVIGSAIARAAGVVPAAISVSVLAASVRIVAEVTFASANARSAGQAAVASAMDSREAATALLAGAGVTVLDAPRVEAVDAPRAGGIAAAAVPSSALTSDGAADSSAPLALSAGIAGGVLLCGLATLLLWMRRRRRGKRALVGKPGAALAGIQARSERTLADIETARESAIADIESQRQIADLNQRTIAEIEAARESAIKDIETHRKLAAGQAATTAASPSTSSDASLGLAPAAEHKIDVASTRSSQLGWLAQLEGNGSPSDLTIDPNVVRDSLRKTLEAERRIAAARQRAREAAAERARKGLETDDCVSHRSLRASTSGPLEEPSSAREQSTGKATPLQHEATDDPGVSVEPPPALVAKEGSIQNEAFTNGGGASAQPYIAVGVPATAVPATTVGYTM